MKKTWRRFIFIIAIVSIAAPIIIGWGVSQDILNNWTNDNDWIGFWGSYIGTMIGSFVTLFVLWSTLEDNRCAREREEKIRYYNNLIDIIATFTTDAANYLAVMERLLKKRDSDTGWQYSETANQTAKSSSILDAQLAIMGDCKNIAKIRDYIKPIEDELDEIADALMTYLYDKNRTIHDMKQLQIKINNLNDKINSFVAMFPEIIKCELKNDNA